MPSIRAMVRFVLSAGLIGLMMLAQPAAAQTAATPAASPAFDDRQRAEIRALIRDYLVRNPDVIQEAMIELEKRQKEAEVQARLKITGDKNGPLYVSPFHTVIGNPDGDVTLVEFFDYNCGYCKRALGDVQRLVENDKNLRVIIKDFPVLGPGSIEAATVVMAAQEQLKADKIWMLHHRLLATRGQVGRAQALEAAREIGADMARLARQMEKPQIREAIQEAIQIADSLGLTGTPSYVVGPDLVVGAVGYDELKSRIDSVRKCGRAVCS